VGLGDSLTPADIVDGERVDDGVPQDLQSCIRAYGLRAFKVKLCGNESQDLARLRALNELLKAETSGNYVCTLDGNENFKTFTAFRDFWQELTAEPLVSEFVKNVIVVEQPVHRSFALADEVRAVLGSWHAHPPLIIDESEGRLGDLSRALTLGYSGSSHKNCKGIVKGIANACLLAHRRNNGVSAVLTGEDLCNLGPVALLQDLAVMALLGLQHVERNGHHYFRGLSLWPVSWQQTALRAHSDLYEADNSGLVRLRVADGMLTLGSVNAASFGVAPLFDPAGAGFERITLPA
jgi:hypothetical protein